MAAVVVVVAVVVAGSSSGSSSSSSSNNISSSSLPSHLIPHRTLHLWHAAAWVLKNLSNCKP